MNNRVTEEIIKITFGDNWLIAAFVFVVAVSAIRFIRKNNLPKYFRKCLIVCVCAIAALIDSKFFQWNEYLGALRIRKVFPLPLLTVIVVTIAIFIYSYMKNDKQLKYVIKNTESDGNIIKAWERLQKIKTINLTPWQKRQYDKRRLYLRVMLGNMCGAEQELKKFENDKAFYHFTKAIIFNFRGNHKDELEEEKIAEGYCDGDTDSFLHFQIISNRGAGYVGAGEYSLANDWFKRAIDFGRVNNVKAPDLWLNLYYNYVFNKTRLNLDISIQECIDMLEEVKQYIDIEDPKQYIGYRNIVIQLFRQKKADKMQLNEIINQDFEYLVNTNLIIVSDYESAKDFYVNKLGFSVIRENYRPERKDWKLDLRVNEHTELEIFAEENPPKRVNRPEACGMRHLAFCVDSVEQTVRELAEVGIECESIRVDDYTGKKMTFFHDPDGLPLELHE